MKRQNFLRFGDSRMNAGNSPLREASDSNRSRIAWYVLSLAYLLTARAINTSRSVVRSRAMSGCTFIKVHRRLARRLGPHFRPMHLPERQDRVLFIGVT